MRRVGILGGMGPQATILLMQKILDAVPATDDADHIPLLVDQNPQVPSRIRRLIEGTGEDPGPVLAAMAQRLVAAGAEALAMPCNTAHHYLPVIRDAVDVPFLDMIALSVAKSVKLAAPGDPIGILASPAVKKIGLFDAAFAKVGVRPLYHGDDASMLSTIRRIKSAGPGPDAERALRTASEALLHRGAKVQMIACTEFSLVENVAADGVLAFDTLDVLVSAIKEFAMTEKNDAGRRTAAAE
jgi:aspartate racemase